MDFSITFKRQLQLQLRQMTHLHIFKNFFIFTILKSRTLCKLRKRYQLIYSLAYQCLKLTELLLDHFNISINMLVFGQYCRSLSDELNGQELLRRYCHSTVDSISSIFSFTLCQCIIQNHAIFETFGQSRFFIIFIQVT